MKVCAPSWHSIICAKLCWRQAHPLIAGKPVPYCLARIPKAGETRGNLAVGGTGVAQDLSPRDREIAETLDLSFSNAV